MTRRAMSFKLRFTTSIRVASPQPLSKGEGLKNKLFYTSEAKVLSFGEDE
jgi:hypothetical protein